jgi:PAS domain S-box-containing protein
MSGCVFAGLRAAAGRASVGLRWWLAMRRALLALSLCCFAFDSSVADRSEGTKRVLVLFPLDVLLPSSYLIGRSLEDALSSGGERFEVFTEFLDAARFPGPDHENDLTRVLRGKYASARLDLLIALGPESLDFLSRHRDSLFPDVPVVFSGVRGPAVPRLPALTTGVVTHFDPLQTLDLALRLQPHATRVVVVTGTSATDRAWEDLARARFAAYEARLAFTYLAGEPVAEVASTLHELPRDSIVLLLSMLRDGAGESFGGGEISARLVNASSAPVYGVYDSVIGSGAVGGYVDRFATLGVEAAALAKRVLAGEPPSSIPPVETTATRYVVDARALRRWDLEEANLPPGAIVEYRQPSLWELHSNKIVVAIGAFLLQTLAVVALLFRNRKLSAERALRESEERYRNVVESQTDLICRYLPDTTLTFVNDAYCRYFGRPREQLIGTRFVELIPEADRVGSLEHVRSLLARPRVENHTHEVLRPDGTIGYQQWIDHVIEHPAGASAEIQGIGRDVTQLRRAERELERQREQVTHLTRVAILGQLAGALAHELRQPLTAILSNAQAAQRLLKRDPLDLAELDDILDDIVADDVRTGEVITRLRSLLKKGEHVLQELDVNTIVRDTLALARGKLVEQRVKVVSDLAQGLPAARGDPVQLQQVLLNLLVNASEAMGEKDPSERKLAVSSSCNGDFVAVAVADAGVGIPPQVADRLFEPFFTTKPQGLGLGLSICESIIAVHGGQLTATNNEDRGATFVFTLPIYTPAVA